MCDHPSGSPLQPRASIFGCRRSPACCSAPSQRVSASDAWMWSNSLGFRCCQSVGSRVPFRQSDANGMLGRAINAPTVFSARALGLTTLTSSTSFFRDAAKIGGPLVLRNNAPKGRLRLHVGSRRSEHAAAWASGQSGAPVAASRAGPLLALPTLRIRTDSERAISKKEDGP